jgi:hypothetical protein
LGLPAPYTVFNFRLNKFRYQYVKYFICYILDLVKGAVYGDHFAVQGVKGAQAEVAMPGQGFKSQVAS